MLEDNTDLDALLGRRALTAPLRERLVRPKAKLHHLAVALGSRSWFSRVRANSVPSMLSASSSRDSAHRHALSHGRAPAQSDDILADSGVAGGRHAAD